MKITFLGATGQVTGSNYLLEHKGTKILIDCGLFQSGFFNDQKNYEPFHFKPSEINAVILTHAHIDHSGRVPVLAKYGFKGKVYATPPTLDFARILLLDSLGVLEKEAIHFGHDLIYNEKDVKNVVELFENVAYDTKKIISNDISFHLRDAGHILGSAIIEIAYTNDKSEQKKIVFSGDLGNYPNLILRRTAEINKADYLVMESTYGGSEHENMESRKAILKATIEETIHRGGVLMIPAFAIERTQEVLIEINELVEHNKIPRVPIFLDSPLAIKATHLFKKYESYFNNETKKVIKADDDIFSFPGLQSCLTTDESKKINHVPPPKIIIAGSGMSNGGRIVHHEQLYLSDPKNTLLIIGYQAQGTLGRKLANKEKIVKIHGVEVEVRATIKKIGGYSAHADQTQLINWIKPMHQTLNRIFLIHGEPETMESLSAKIHQELTLKVTVPILGESFDLE